MTTNSQQRVLLPVYPAKGARLSAVNAPHSSLLDFPPASAGGLFRPLSGKGYGLFQSAADCTHHPIALGGNCETGTAALNRRTAA
jgi:hypothetical protein